MIKKRILQFFLFISMADFLYAQKSVDTFSAIHLFRVDYSRDEDQINEQFKQLNITPVLIEARINRELVPVAKVYETHKSARLFSLKFSSTYDTGLSIIYQFALSPGGRFENFDENNILNIGMPNGKHTLFIRGVDFNKKVFTKNTQVQINAQIDVLNEAWFWILITLLIIAPFFYLFYKSRLNRQRAFFKQQLALELQRKKITADLHDDIGATLSSLQINSGVAAQLLNKKPDEAKKILAKIAEQAESVAGNLGDIIWSMKPGKDEFMTMSIRIKNFVNDIAGATNIYYKTNIDKNIDTLVKDITARKNIILIIKEAVNNAAKYSGASQLDIKVALVNSDIKIEISDNGIGFKNSNISGNGISNMQKRAEELNGTFKIVSSPQNGTTILVVFPLIP